MKKYIKKLFSLLSKNYLSESINTQIYTTFIRNKKKNNILYFINNIRKKST